MWPPKLTARDERTRAARGLIAKRDGWYKTIGGKTRYVCRKLPLAEAVQLLDARFGAGVTTRVIPEAITLDALVDMFLEDCASRAATGTPKQLARSTLEDYRAVLPRFSGVVGPERLAATIGPDDFTRFVRSLAGRAGTTVRREMQYVDRLFNWAGPGKRSMNLIPYVQRGPSWIKPTDRSARDKSYSVDDLQRSFQTVHADPLLLCAWHLGFGCGFIPKDVATLRDDQVDLHAGVITFPTGRGKTGSDRLCALVPSAVVALAAWLEHRRTLPCTAEAEGLFFRSVRGNPLGKWYGNSVSEDNVVKKRWSKLVGLPYTGLRTTLATIADDWPDQRAVDVLLGHSSGKGSSHVRSRHYARQFNPERTRLVAAHAYALVFHGPNPIREREPWEVAAGSFA